MPLPLDQWDKDVAPHLQEIEWSSGWVRRYIAKIMSACHAIAARPSWDTKAEDELDRTIAFLEEAVAGLRRAKELYSSRKLDS